jgi:hypothetical protein
MIARIATRMPASAFSRSVGVDRQRDARRRRRGGKVRAGRGREPVFALAEDDGGKLEEEPEDGVEHEILRILP